jgi:hypothetical protein
VSREQHNDDCRGCKPALINSLTRQLEPEDSPRMKAILEVWWKTTREEREAWHAATCLGDTSPDAMRLVRPLVLRFQQVVNEVRDAQDV